MRLSIIIPAYDLAQEVERTLAGIFVQRRVLDSFEVIIIDLNSRLDSLEAVHRRHRDALPVYLIQLPKLEHRYSLSLARNTGMRFARYDWVACLDADCIPGPSYFECLKKSIDVWAGSRPILSAERIFIDARNITAGQIMSEPTILARMPRILSDSNYQLRDDRRLGRLRNLSSPHGIPHPWDVIHGCNMIFRREDALAIGGYDESYDGCWGYEDIDFAYRMISQHGCRPVFAEGCHVFHQERTGDDCWEEVRRRKAGNPNWERIIHVIPGYVDFKKNLYSEFSGISI